jgi:hypothetical protein
MGQDWWTFSKKITTPFIILLVIKNQHKISWNSSVFFFFLKNKFQCLCVSLYICMPVCSFQHPQKKNTLFLAGLFISLR